MLHITCWLPPAEITSIGFPDCWPAFSTLKYLLATGVDDGLVSSVRKFAQPFLYFTLVCACTLHRVNKVLSSLCIRQPPSMVSMYGLRTTSGPRATPNGP